MNRIKYLTGQRFGRLTALDRLDNGRYVCECDCGQTVTVRRENLTTGNTKSCGCLKAESDKRSKAKENSRELAIARYYKRNAKVAGRTWNLSQEQLEHLLHGDCVYCGESPAMGVDRLDSSQGYEMSNVASCCATCNRAKLTMSVEAFYRWIERVYEHHNGADIPNLRHSLRTREHSHV